MTIGERIKYLRLDKGLTQKELAELAHISVVTLQQYERGVRKEPKEEQLEGIAETLGTSAAFLRGYVDNPTIDLNKIAQRAEELRISDELKQGIHRTSLPDYDMQMAIDDAEEELLYTVHRICGMDNTTISEDFLNGSLGAKWNPKKIDIIREFIEDCQPALQKKFASLESPSKTNTKGK